MNTYKRYLRIRDEKGVRDVDVSKSTGIGRSTFSDWKSGRSNPKIKKLKLLADYFGVEVEYFTSEKEEKMDNLQIFNNEEFGQIRTVTKEDKTYFVGNDVAKALGYTETAKAIRTHCKGVSEMDIPTNGGIQKVKVITEGDIYRLVIKSQLPKADEFESWIFDNVLPSIRKAGGYIAGQEQMSDAELMAKALLVAQKQIEQRNAQIAEMQPKADFFDAVADSKSAFSMNEVAKVLDYKGIGRNKLFEFLREQNILDRYNVPYQRYVDNGWFRVIEQKYMKNGEPIVSTKTLVYQKGIDGIRKKLQSVFEND